MEKDNTIHKMAHFHLEKEPKKNVKGNFNRGYYLGQNILNKHV